jgi:hypothetical protein
VTSCDGEECDGLEHGHHVRRIFVGDEGEVHHLDGGPHVWMGAGARQRGFLGVQLTELTPELREHFGAPSEAGVLVSRVVPDSPAFRAGVEVGDIITSLDGESVASASALSHEVRSRSEGGAAALELYRDGRLQTLTADLEVRQASARHAKMMILECADGEPCEVELESAGGMEPHDLSGFDCGGGPECRVEIRCEGDGSCSCTANGEEIDCEEVPGFHGRRG